MPKQDEARGNFPFDSAGGFPPFHAKIQNEDGQMMDLYIPRKCSATNRLITAKDHASVQINVGHIDNKGIYTGQFSTFALCGFVRSQGDADGSLDRLSQKERLRSISSRSFEVEHWILRCGEQRLAYFCHCFMNLVSSI